MTHRGIAKTPPTPCCRPGSSLIFWFLFAMIGWITLWKQALWNLRLFSLKRLLIELIARYPRVESNCA